MLYWPLAAEADMYPWSRVEHAYVIFEAPVQLTTQPQSFQTETGSAVFPNVSVLFSLWSRVDARLFNVNWREPKSSPVTFVWHLGKQGPSSLRTLPNLCFTFRLIIVVQETVTQLFEAEKGAAERGGHDNNYQGRWKPIYSACHLRLTTIKRLEGAVTGALDAWGESSVLESRGSVTGLSVHIPDTFIRPLEPAEGDPVIVRVLVCVCVCVCSRQPMGGSSKKGKIEQERGHRKRGF